MLNNTPILAIDNLNDYDPTSLQLICKLIPLLLASQVKVVYTATPEAMISIPIGYKQDTLMLGDLKAQQSQEIVEFHLPLVSKEALRLLHKISRSNVKFLVALLNQIKGFEDYGNDLLTEKTLQEWQSRGKVSLNMDGILLAKYLSYPASMRNFLKLLSIFANPFSISDMVSYNPEMDSSSIASCVNQLLHEGVLELINSADIPLYNFENPLFMDSIYRSILLSEKQHLHFRFATMLETQHSTNVEHMPLIIHHFLQADRKDKVLHYSRILADIYFKAGAWSSSFSYYEKVSLFCSDKKERISSILRMAECSIMLGDNHTAKALLDIDMEVDMPEYDYWVYLFALYLNNIAEYTELKSFLESKLTKLRIKELKPLIKNVYLESCLFSNDLKPFFKEALKLYPTLNEIPAVQHKLAGIIAQAYINTGDYKTAEKYYRNKLILAESLHDNVALRIACNGVGTALSRRGIKDTALEFYNRALKYSEQEGDRNGYAKVILNLGVHHRNQMDYEQALECYNKSLLLSRHIGNLMQESITLFDMGELYYYRDDYVMAKTLFNQSLELAIRINDYTGVSFCRDALGDLLFKAGEYSQAEAVYRDNLILQKRINDREGIAHTWGNLGNIAKSKKDYREARKLYYRQLKMVTKIQDIDDAGRARFNLAMIAREQGYYKRALHQLSKAKELFESCQAKNFCDMCSTQEAEIRDLLS